ncbi:piggyBac transposable element-derived protein 1-like [Danaus plexippus]|uniref:piggyBac transposable element-derived protein 1-like n=1 Tax=Danaus plexippus TaxID=13037 RepID=UPI002AAFE61B|nr:piggyBac transposable element-derived protein 1-like [Danaus plexippus]
MSHYIKQYMPNKPHKWGFKLYLICSLQGYAHRFEVYSGGGSKNNILPGEPDLGESGNTVIRIARMVPRNVNHIIYFDNFYTSVPLVTYLAKEGIFSLGTVRVNRLRNCKLPEKNTIMKKNVPRGFYEENVATVDGIDVSAVVWKDNKPVNLLSTYVGAEPATTVTRFDKSKKERVAIPCPKVIKEYNARMGGVDLLDSFIGPYHITMKSRKWTMCLFYHFLDLAVINSWVMFKKVNNMKGNDQLLNLGTFRLELAETLCKLGLPANGAKGGRPSGSTIQRELVMKKFCGPAQAIPLKDVRLDQTCHWAVWLDKAAEVQIPEMFRLYI